MKEIAFENIVCKMAAILSRVGEWVYPWVAATRDARNATHYISIALYTLEKPHYSYGTVRTVIVLMKYG